MRRADATVFFGQQILIGKFVQPAIAPFDARLLMQIFGEGLGKSVGQRRGHDGVVVVELGF